MGRHGMPAGQIGILAILTTLERVWAQKLSMRGECRGRRDRAPDKICDHSISEGNAIQKQPYDRSSPRKVFVGL